jgi:hypothetical protein
MLALADDPQQVASALGGNPANKTPGASKSPNNRATIILEVHQSVWRGVLCRPTSHCTFARTATRSIKSSKWRPDQRRSLARSPAVLVADRCPHAKANSFSNTSCCEKQLVTENGGADNACPAIFDSGTTRRCASRGRSRSRSDGGSETFCDVTHAMPRQAPGRILALPWLRYSLPRQLISE